MKKNETSVISLSEDENELEWIVTYADLVTLLLVFFILLFSMSTLDLMKFKNAIKSIQVSLGQDSATVELLEIISEPEDMGRKVRLEDITGIRSTDEALLEEINDFIKEEELGDNIVLRFSEGKINIQIRGKVLFGSGESELNIEANPILDKIVELVEDYNEYFVNIKGFTDNVPIKTDRFPSNWELSAYRATTVLKYLVGNGINPGRLTATGYGKLMPLVPNDSEKNRSINRRVEFVLEKKKELF